MNDQVSGVFTADPTEGAPPGMDLSFQPTLFPPLSEPAFGVLEPWTHFGEVLLTIVFGTSEGDVAQGSGVLIGPGLALAAKHVFEDHIEDLLASRKDVIASSITEHGLMFWSVTQIVMQRDDLAILVLKLASALPPENLFRVAALTTRTPRVGEIVQIAGFRPGEFSGPDVAGNVHVSIGEIKEVHRCGRDRVLLNFPCLEIWCDTLGGMSGGPAFDQSGHLIGILTSGFDEKPSYVSPHWPCLARPISTFWLQGFVDLPTNILELSKRRVVALERPDAVTSIENRHLVLKNWS